MTFRLIEKYSEKLAKYNEHVIIIFVTAIVTFVSVLLVYVATVIFGVEYTNFLLALSIVVPILQAPPVMSMVLKSSKYLKTFRDELDKEIQKNKEADLILFEQARFALMGEMMANVSHQWKQPLNTIGLAVVAMRTSNQDENELDRHYEIIEDNINHLASTVDDFMSFFDQRTHNEIRNLDSIVKEIKSIIYSHIANKNIELEITIDNSYGDIEIASSISQIILNLLNNAKDALEESGKRKEIKLQFTSNEHGLEIECCDNGKGIDKNIKDKIFDPYFSTKEKKQGTGIGLYMSKEIVQKIFNGKIALSSREISRSTLHPLDNSEKTCFYIALPYSQSCVLKEKY